jgi:hypothetical protein
MDWLLTPILHTIASSDRTSCCAPLANQMRLILHTAADWLMLDRRDNIPKTHALAVAEFATLREKLLKIGARVVETASRIRLALATACPHAGLFLSRVTRSVTGVSRHGVSWTVASTTRC